MKISQSTIFPGYRLEEPLRQWKHQLANYAIDLQDEIARSASPSALHEILPVLSEVADNIQKRLNCGDLTADDMRRYFQLVSDRVPGATQDQMHRYLVCCVVLSRHGNHYGLSPHTKLNWLGITNRTDSIAHVCRGERYDGVADGAKAYEKLCTISWFSEVLALMPAIDDAPAVSAATFRADPIESGEPGGMPPAPAVSNEVPIVPAELGEMQNVPEFVVPISREASIERNGLGEMQNVQVLAAPIFHEVHIESDVSRNMLLCLGGEGWEPPAATLARLEGFPTSWQVNRQYLPRQVTVHCRNVVFWAHPANVLSNLAYSERRDKVVLSQQLLTAVGGGQHLSSALGTGLPVAVFIDTRTEIGSRLAAACDDTGPLSACMQLIDINPAAQRNNDVASLATGLYVDRVYHNGLDAHRTRISMMLAQIAGLPLSLEIESPPVPVPVPVRVRGPNDSDTYMNGYHVLGDVLAHRAYRGSEQEELIKLFLERIETCQFMDNYTNRQKRVIEIDTLPIQFVRTDKVQRYLIRNQAHLDFLKQHLDPCSYAVDEAIDVSTAPRNIADAIGLAYEKAKEQHIELLGPEGPFVYALEPDPSWSPRKLWRSEQQAVLALLDQIHLVDVLTQEDGHGHTLSVARHSIRTKHRASAEVLDGRYIVHNSQYDRDLLLKILTAVKSRNTRQFVQSMAEFAAGWPTNNGMDSARATFLQEFSRLYVTGQFSSLGMKHTYYHFLLRCGQIY